MLANPDDIRALERMGGDHRVSLSWLRERGLLVKLKAHAFLTVPEVAAMFKRQPATVREWARSGRLRGARLSGREWTFTSEAVAAFQESGG